MELSEEEKTLISMLNIVDTYIENTKVTKVIFSMEDAKILYDLIKRQQKETEREKQYSDFYKDLCNKQQKKLKELIKTCDLYKSASDHCAEIFSDTIKPNYISKGKIREKIKDYTEKSKHPLVNSQSRREYTFGLKALKELLEED